MKTAIVYYSKHHSNTKKVIEYMVKDKNVDLIDAINGQDVDLSQYDLIGFASGIYYSKFHKSVIKFAAEKLPINKKVFFVYTCGAKKEGYTKSIKEITAKKSAEFMGEYGCLGFDSFGPLKLVGGIAKGHPDNKELNEAKRFFEEISK